MDEEELIPRIEVYNKIYSQLIEERILYLCTPIEAISASTLSAYLISLSRTDPEKEITIYINSPGGDIIDGLITIYDTMQAIPTPIKTICIGEAFSSAAVILSAGSKGKRYAYQNARIMIHSIQTEVAYSSQQEFEKEFKRTKKLNDWLLETVARHTGQTLRKIRKDCKEDKFMTAEEALKYGIIDEIIAPLKEIPPLRK